MSRLILVRHGQASFGSDNYDQLSELGHQQAHWLGEYFAAQDLPVSRVICGDLLRHRQTVSGILSGLGQTLPTDQKDDWNEFDFHAVGAQFLAMHPEYRPDNNSPKAFFGLLRRALLAWSKNEITGSLPETWAEFETRILRALDAVISSAEKHENILVVSSGGAIAMALKHILAYPNDKVIDINLQTRNTGVSEIYFNATQRYLASFNCLPHLSQAERSHAITSA
ncbi:MAG: histidine phosphatase family protein [Oleiphilaceae bacterium]|nr:histidine phosphatase family protein [Oleiphilaceae bacterium]